MSVAEAGMTECLALAEGSSLVSQTGLAAASPASETQPSRDFLPVLTRQKVAKDAEHMESIELRAYKLGKKRWLYNECRLNLMSESGFLPPLEVAESCRQGEDQIPDHLQECGVAYGLKLKCNSNLKLDLEVFVAFDSPQAVEGVPDQASPNLMDMSGFRQTAGYQWPPVHRTECQKGCDGPILRSIQRYGRISRRTGKKNSPDSEVQEDRAKDPRFLYLSIDEASTHVGGKRFRLVAAVYSPGDRKLLGSCCSLPIQVLANNDAPNGPATIDLDIAISSCWEGWAAVQESVSEDPQPRNNSSESLQREHYGLEIGEPTSSVHIGSSWHSSLGPQTSRARIDLQWIRERAMQSGEDEEGSLAFDEGLPAPKRTRSSYGLEADVPISPFYHRMGSVTPQLTSSGFSTMSTYLTPDRLRIEHPTEHSSLDASMHLQDLEPASMRHNSATESSNLASVRHHSLPTGLPDLSVMRSGSVRTMQDVALRQNSGYGGRVRYNSAPFQGGLLSELQAQRSSFVDSRENTFWASLSNPQTPSAASSVYRQTSSPASLLPPMRDAEALQWASSANSRVHHAQNPGLSGTTPSGHLSNPFAQQGGARDEAFWGQHAQAAALHNVQQRNDSPD